MIRKCCSLLFLLLLAFCAGAQNMVYATTRKPTPGDEIASKQPGKYINGETASYKPGYWDNAFASQMTKRTDKMLGLIKETFPGPTGIDILYTREMFQRSYGLGGSRSYMMTFGCQTYGVAKEIGSRQTFVGKTADGGYIIPGLGGPTLVFKVNDPSALFASGITLDLDGRSAHMTFDIQGNWKGCVAYGTRFFGDSAISGSGVLYLCIARPGESPFIPFTRKEFLQARLNQCDEKYRKDTAMWNKNPQYAQRQVDDARAAGKPANEIARLQTEVRNAQQRSNQGLKRAADELQANRKPILTYLASKPADTLALPALVYGYRDGDDVEECFNPKRKLSDPRTYVVDNPAYWHNNADKATPQLIILKMQFSTQQWREYEIKKQFVANFPLEKFLALLDK